MLDEQTRTMVLEVHTLMSILWKASGQSTDRMLQEKGLDTTRLQLGVLRFLDQEGAHTISELSRKFGLDPSTLVPTVDALERKGYVLRERDPQDRRRIPLTLTDDGRGLLAQIPSVPDGHPMLNALSHLGEERATEFIRLLHEMVRTLPDSDELLEHAETRLIAHGAKEQYLVCKRQET